MPEKNEGQAPKEESDKNEKELLYKFTDLDDEAIAHSVTTGELFNFSAQGEKTVSERIENIENKNLKNEALFRIANLYYREKNNLTLALNKAEAIDNESEKTRCLVQLAVAVLENEGNLELADNIIHQVIQDKEDYRKYYQIERQKFIDKKEN